MARRPPAFLFDLDGTLADTIGDIAATANHVRRSCGLPDLPVDEVRAFVGHGARELLRKSLAGLGLPDDAARWEQLYRLYAEHHERQCTRTVQLYPGVRAHLEALAAGGHPLGVVTNKPERFARRIVEHLGLGALLPVIVGGDSTAARKPDPAPLRRALSLLGADARGATMVGDGETDLAAGRAAGLRTVACLFGYRPAEVLRALGADEYWQAFGRPAAPG